MLHHQGSGIYEEHLFQSCSLVSELYFTARRSSITVYLTNKHLWILIYSFYSDISFKLCQGNNLLHHTTEQDLRKTMCQVSNYYSVFIFLLADLELCFTASSESSFILTAIDSLILWKKNIWHNFTERDLWKKRVRCQTLIKHVILVTIWPRSSV